MSDNISTQLLNDLENEVHVWFCRPDEVMDTIILDGYRSILSAEESEKHDRFYFEKDRHSYLVSHALVRKVLSSYCAVKPEEWRFTISQHGKPEISSAIKCPAIKFNLSHTDGMSAVVVTLDADCGVDVENITRRSKTLAVAERMFAEPEVAVMRDSEDSHLNNIFFEYWTLREAYVKALGTGLGGSSKEFYFIVEGEHQNSRVADLHFVEAGCKKSSPWNFVLLKPSSEHVIAVSFKMNKLEQSLDEQICVISKRFQP